MPANIAIFALTKRGAQLAHKLAALLLSDCYVLDRYASESDIPFTSLKDTVADKFHKYESHVFVAASGIVVRMIAPLLKSKDVDPAVVVVDQEGEFAISLVSGHLGGANELARLVGDKIGAVPVITTATDCAGVPSMDLLARDQGLSIGDIGLIKHINAALLDGEQVPVYDPDGFLDISAFSAYFYVVDDVDVLSESCCGVVVDWRKHKLPERCLALYPRCLTLGVGCRRGVPADEILELVRSVVADNGIALESIFCMGSIDAKSDEAGMIEAAEILGLDLKFFSAAELDEIEVANPSGMVMKHMGVGGVCEAAAMKLADSTEILIPKTKSARVTAAIARKI
ncbi:cobalamin biosynthesis protein [Desulfovibrio sp. JC010]|uniref:cobalt-precorrin 5A hydrolase n=1 Tax=Desulfovibrio sp. JC010 TaxID=2593641 RepID=UPI0013D0D5FF|nr:cobalamin biosynthesis protein [Desulfovibrio sp. JC010]NDV25377.1 cobalamin biosynthesis protein CbiG [Desulfovibrio sp. JC010]